MSLLTKLIVKGLRRPVSRSYASSTKIVDVTHDDNIGVTTLSMTRPPVNGLNLELLVELRKALKQVESDGRKGVIITSSLPTIFSGGLDIMEMYKRDKNQLTDFWHALQDLWLTLYGLSLPTTAAVNGASPAGGCLLAISCEYKVFVEGKHSIGLNETKLGIIAPKWFRDPFIATIGYNQAELALLRGTLFSPQEALRIGLVNELATDKADAIAKCIKYIISYDKIPAEARKVTKLAMRGSTLSWLENNREHDTDAFISYIQLPKVQKGLDFYIQSLKAK